MPQYIIVKLLTSREKEKILKAIKRKTLHDIYENKREIIIGFSPETMEARKQWNIFKC